MSVGAFVQQGDRLTKWIAVNRKWKCSLPDQRVVFLQSGQYNSRDVASSGCCPRLSKWPRRAYYRDNLEHIKYLLPQCFYRSRSSTMSYCTFKQNCKKKLSIAAIIFWGAVFLIPGVIRRLTKRDYRRRSRIEVPYWESRSEKYIKYSAYCESRHPSSGITFTPLFYNCISLGESTYCSSQKKPNMIIPYIQHGFTVWK